MRRPTKRQKEDFESSVVFETNSLSGHKKGMVFRNKVCLDTKTNLVNGAAILAVLILRFAIQTIVSSVGGDIPHAAVVHPAFAKGNIMALNKGNVELARANINILSHTKSGMSIMTVVPNDWTQDAVFGVSFRTPLSDNRGLASITEHAVQAGSRTYPAMDPINQLHAGSLQTHLETWSEADRTSFTFASRNFEDYKISMAVMLDGIFQPLLGETDFEWIYRQEGWRLEDGTNLYVSGNAYNRARAALLVPEDAMQRFVYSRLFEEHTYGYNPKGIYNEIISGVRGHMIKFYNSWYHPSNGRVFCYGAPKYVNACLDAIDKAVTPLLSDEAKKTVLHELGLNLPQSSKIGFKMLNTIQTVAERIPYASLGRNGDFRLSISWVLNDKPMDQRAEVAWHLIYQMLIGSSCFGYDPMSKLNTNLQQWVMTMGVSGLPTEASADEARTKMINKLAEISQNGFDREAMAAALNKVEFMLRDLNSKDGSPQGVHMFKKVLRKWNYDLDPTLALTLLDEFKILREQLEDPDNVEGMEFILELMTKGLSDNTAQAIATIFPSAEMQKSAQRNEDECLNKKFAKSRDAKKSRENDGFDKAILKKNRRETAEFHRVQEQGDPESDIATIPRVSPLELSKDPFEIPTTVIEGPFNSDLTMLENLVPDSNNIAYVEFTIDISNMAFKDAILLPLMCLLFFFAETKRKSDVQIQQHIELYTRGLTIEPLVEEVYEFQEDHGYKVYSGKHMVTKLLVRTSCFAEKGCAEPFNLIKTVIYDSVIDNRDKVITILQDIIDHMEDDIQRNGPLYTTRRIESLYTLPGFIREQWFGITQLYSARAALREAEDDHKWDDFSTRLLVAHDAIKRTHHSGLLLSITGNERAIQDIRRVVKLFVNDVLPAAAQRTPFPDFSKVEHPWVIDGKLAMDKRETRGDIAFLVPTMVADVGGGGCLYQPGEHISGAHMVAIQYLVGFFLNEKIRFNIGASQAWAQLDLSGVVVLQSKETRSIFKTLEIFRDAGGWMQRQMEGHENLPVEAKAAIIGTVGKMDGAALQPDDVGLVGLLQFLKQDTKEGRQWWRDEALNATKEDFMFVANRLAGWGGESISGGGDVFAITNERMVHEAMEQSQHSFSLSFQSLADQRSYRSYRSYEYRSHRNSDGDEDEDTDG